jgi:hypothetical protein
MRPNETAPMHEIVSKVTITKEAKPDLVKNILTWVKDHVAEISQKDRF